MKPEAGKKQSSSEKNKRKAIVMKNEARGLSEERYHKMIAEVRDYAIFLLDNNGKVLDWNLGAEKLKGYTASEITGKSFRLFYPKEDRDANVPEKLLEEARKNGSVSLEGWRIRKDGSAFWGSVVITALHDEDGNSIGFSKVTRDLTDRKNAEDRLINIANELRKSEARYHGMIAEVQDYAIILLNTKGEIENWNAGAENIKGYSAKEIVGKSFKLFYTSEDRENKLPERLLEEARKSGKVIHEGWRVRKDGTRFWGSVVITALHDPQGNVIGFSKVTRDLTERKEAEDTLRLSAAQLDLKNKTLERLNEELLSYNYVVSHDLKEPLRKIQTFATRMEQQEELSGSGKDYLEKIKTSSAQMQNLIEDLLSYSTVSNDPTKFEQIDLNEILQTVKKDLEIAIVEKKAEIQTTDLPVLYGIPLQFHQLFLNLLGNALKFSKTNEHPVIKIYARVVEGPDIPTTPASTFTKYHHISISDNGIGFESVYSTKIFEVFQRLHTKNNFTGTGIGLAIVKKVVKNHNGIVLAEGQPNVGATFHLYLPFTYQ